VPNGFTAFLQQETGQSNNIAAGAVFTSQTYAHTVRA